MLIAVPEEASPSAPVCSGAEVVEEISCGMVVAVTVVVVVAVVAVAVVNVRVVSVVVVLVVVIEVAVEVVVGHIPSPG